MKKTIAVLLLSVLMAVSLVAEAKGGFSGGGGRGGFSSAGRSSFSSGSYRSSYSSPARSTTVTTTTRSYRSGGGYYGGGMNYGGMGMGYGYSNGLITGMILGNLMHPSGTVMYTGGGQYNNNALLYPDGRVVNQQGYQVGTYIDGQFTPVDGGMVAQPAPQAQAQPQPVIIQNDQLSNAEAVFLIVVFSIFMILIFGAILC